MLAEGVFGQKMLSRLNHLRESERHEAAIVEMVPSDAAENGAQERT